MPEREHPSQRGLRDLRQQLEIDLQRPVDFTASDSDSLTDQVRYLTLTARYNNILAVQEFGGRVGAEREQGLAEQAIAAAFQSFGGHDPHPDPFDKAAVILRGITQGHPFNDGNKRTGYLTAAYYLEQMGYLLPEPYPEEEIVALCLSISAAEIRDVDIIVDRLRKLWNV